MDYLNMYLPEFFGRSVRVVSVFIIMYHVACGKNVLKLKSKRNFDLFYRHQSYVYYIRLEECLLRISTSAKKRNKSLNSFSVNIQY